MENVLSDSSLRISLPFHRTEAWKRFKEAWSPGNVLSGFCCNICVDGFCIRRN